MEVVTIKMKTPSLRDQEEEKLPLSKRGEITSTARLVFSAPWTGPDQRKAFFTAMAFWGRLSSSYPFRTKRTMETCLCKGGGNILVLQLFWPLLMHLRSASFFSLVLVKGKQFRAMIPKPLWLAISQQSLV